MLPPSRVAQCKRELSAEIVRTICCPSGEDEDGAACWFAAIVVVVVVVVVVGVADEVWCVQRNL